MQGWIKLHRSLVEWEWYDDINTKTLFIHLLLKASHASKKWRGITLQPGQIRMTVSDLAKETGLSTQNVRTSINKLKLTNEITIKTTNRNTLISINSWTDYQQDNRQTNKQLTNNQQTTNKPTSGLKNVKNDKNVKKYISINKISNKDLKEIANKYSVPLHFVESKYEDMVNWHESTGSVRKDWIATLRNFVKKDKGKVKLETFEPKNKENLERVKFMKKKLGMK